MPHQRVNRWLNALALGLAIAFAGCVAMAISPLAELEERVGLHWMFRLRGPVPAPSEVIIVAIDEDSAQKLGLPERPRDWPRSVHAELVRYLAREGARIVVFDMPFEAPQPLHDAEFAGAMAETNFALITESIRTETVRLPGSAGGEMVIEKRVPPASVLARAALGSAPFLLPKDSRVSAYWTFWGDSGDSPTLPVLAFHVYGWEGFLEFMAGLRRAQPQLSLGAAGIAPPWLASDDGVAATRLAHSAMRADPRVASQMLPYEGKPTEVHPLDNRRRLLHSFVSLYSEGDARYLNFYGPPGTVETVSYARVLQAARGTSFGPTPSFANRAVFVGYSAFTPAGQDRIRDDYRTVFSQPNGLDLSGVEIAATAFANLLEDRPLRPLHSPWPLAIVALWGLLLGPACRLPRPALAVALTATMTALLLPLLYACFAQRAWWLPSVILVGLQMPLALFAGVWLSYRESKMERETIRQAFGYFLPRAVVEQLSRDLGPVTLTNHLVYGACLSTDVEHYTTLAEHMDPKRLGEVMNEYYAQLFVPVERSQGVVVDVVGDAMVAIWAKASSNVVLRRNACGAALEMVAALDRFNSLAARGAGRPALQTRFGLHAGEMLVGSIGGSGHYEYRAVGDIVNTASRIQTLNKLLRTRLLASEETVAGLDEFVTRPLGSFLLEGKTNAVSVVELLGRKVDVGERASRACEDFASALSDFNARRWSEASRGFASILAVEPDDGPPQFYRERCERLLQHAPEEGWTPTIRIDGK